VEEKSALRPGDYERYLFDLDGTLFSIPVDWMAVRNELAALAGVPFEGTPLFLKLGQVISERPALQSQAFSIIDSHELRVADSAKPMPGASELLYSLFEVSKIGLVTMQGRRFCDYLLRRHKLTDLFETVVTREDSVDRYLQLEAALNRMGGRAAGSLFIGDRVNDVVNARKAKLKVALIADTQQGEPKPDYGFTSLLELKAWLT